jgi:branched-chain amino acid transport system substrate-binding protein
VKNSSLGFAFALLTGGLAVVLALIGCSRSQKPEAQATIRIGVIAPFDTPPGEGIRNGVKMAVEELNAAGGVLGRPLEIVEVNDEYSAEKSLRGYQRLAGKDGVVAVLGVAGDGIFPIMEQLQTYKVPMITTGIGSDRLTQLVAENPARYKWFFRVMHRSSELGQATTDFALNCLGKKHGIKKFAIMVEDDVWTKIIRDMWVKAIGDDPDAEVVYDTTFTSQTQDFGLILQQIAASGAEYILDAASRVDATTYLKRWATMPNAPPIGAIPTGAGTKRYYDLIGEKGLYVCSVATIPSEQNPLTPRSAEWAAKYRARFGDAEYTSAYSYDAVHILAGALQRANSTSPDTLIGALEQTDYPGAVGRWTFGPDHHPIYGEGYRQIPIIQYIEPTPKGFRVIWPPSRAKAEYVKPQWTTATH